MPPAEDAVHATLAAAGTPIHEVVNAEAAPSRANDSTNGAPAIETATFFLNIMQCNFSKPYNLDVVARDISGSPAELE